MQGRAEAAVKQNAELAERAVAAFQVRARLGFRETAASSLSFGVPGASTAGVPGNSSVFSLIWRSRCEHGWGSGKQQRLLSHLSGRRATASLKGATHAHSARPPCRQFKSSNLADAPGLLSRWRLSKP
jgi:hypothetical protein